MKFLELRLMAFGAFHDAVLDFRRAPSGLHIIYGPNEAGKSTALRAIVGLLFGFPTRTRDDHLFPAKLLRVGALLEYGNGRSLEVVRRKGRKQTLSAPNGEPIDEAVLSTALGGISERLYVTGFGLNHETLRSGSHALLEGQGEVGQSLFGAGLGLLSIHRSLVRLREEAEALFTPRGRGGKRLNAALAEYKKAKEQVVLNSTSAQGYLAQEAALDVARQERTELASRRVLLARRRAQLERMHVALPKLARRRELLAELELTLGTPEIGPESAARRRAAQAELGRAERAFEVAAADVERVRGRLVALGVAGSLLDVSPEEVLDVRNRLGRARAALADRPKLLVQRAALEKRVAEILEELRPGHPVSEVERLRVRGPRLARVKRLARTHEALLAQSEQLAKVVRGQVARRDRVIVELGALSPAGSETGSETELARNVERAVQARPLFSTIAARRAEIEVTERTVQELVASWGGLQGPKDAASLLGLPLPLRQVVEEHQLALEEARRAVDAGRASVAATLRAAERAREELSALGGDELLRDGATLEGRRGERDAAWQRLRDGWDDERSREKLAREFEDCQARSDRAMDALLRDAERLGRARALGVEISSRQTAWEQERERCTAQEARLRDLEHAYARLWPAALEPESPAVMLEWLSRWESLRDLVSKQRVLEADLTGQREALRGATAGLRREDQARDIIDVVALDGQIERCQRLLEERRASAARRRELDAQLAALDEAARESELEAADLGRERERWSAEWQEAIGDVMPDRAAHPEEVIAMLDELGELFTTLEKERSLAGRVEGIDRDNQELERRVAELSRQHLAGLDHVHWMDTAQELIDAHQKAVLEEQERKSATLELAGSEEAQRHALSQREAATQEMARLCRAAGVENVQALELAEVRAQERAGLASRLADLEEDLTLAGGGQSLAQLEESSQEFALDGPQAEMEEVEREERELEERLRDGDITIGKCEAGLQRLGEGAAGAAAEAEMRLSTVRALVERYVRARLASTLLEGEIERYRRENEGPVLARANQLFPRLTGGRYAALRTGFDDRDQQVLVCVRADGTEVAIADLSDGTRDQLYLALRLASLDRHTQRAEPLPLVLDDILVHSDDERAEAAFRVLAEYARRGQILFFTHHGRLVELARRAVEPELLVEHELPGPVVPEAASA